MPVIVVLSDCPPKLRGDMTKWFFEINTGVYVGNISARVRENLWTRITENIGRGHATMVYSSPGEQRMDFRVHNAYWEPVDFDGIKLMRRPEQKYIATDQNQQKKEVRFSNAAKHRMASSCAKKANEYDAFCAASYVVLDFETTGLDVKQDRIIEIGAILVDRGQAAERMQMLVRISEDLPQEITHLTGIERSELLEKGETIENAIQKLLDFAEDLPFVCHNAPFEQAFLLEACSCMNEKPENRFIDTLEMSQKILPDRENYKLTALADFFGIPYSVRHRALTDCEATYGIYTKLMELIFSEREKTSNSEKAREN